jgi:hypothetical protein
MPALLAFLLNGALGAHLVYAAGLSLVNTFAGNDFFNGMSWSINLARKILT